MICPTCGGKPFTIVTHELTLEQKRRRFSPLNYVSVCPDCLGGIAHCCDGIQEQPDGNCNRPNQSETKDVPNQMLRRTDV